MLDHCTTPVRLDKRGPSPKSVAERFWPNVQKTETCWLWTGALRDFGYGVLSVGSVVDHTQRTARAHHIAWEMASGAPIPGGLSVLHTCDVPNCIRNDDVGTYEVRGVVRPRFGHLFLGTLGDNCRDMVAKHRHIGTTGARWTKRPETINRGERAGQAKLTAADVREMRILHAASTPYAEISERYNVSKTTAWNVCRRHTWTHIE